MALLGLGRGKRDQASLRAGEAFAAFLEQLTPPYRVDEMLLQALTGLSDLYPAEGYYGYVADGGDKRPQLRVTRTGSGMPRVGPNYAGLVTGAPIRQVPLDVEPQGEEVCALIDGPQAEPFLSLHCGPKMVLRVALGEGVHPSEAECRPLLEYARRIKPIATLVLFSQEMAEASGDSARQVESHRSAMTWLLQGDRMLSIICRLGGEALSAPVAYLADLEGEGPERLVWTHGSGDELFAALPPQALLDAFPDLELADWSAPNIPSAVHRLGLKGLVAVICRSPDRAAVALFAAHTPIEPTEAMRGIMERLHTSVRRFVTSHHASLALSTDYVSSLETLADLLDESDAFNDGHHSDLVAGVAVRIARQMGLSEGEIADVRRAGKLHDVGMIAVALDIPQKPGTISENERALVAQHPDFGADLLSGLPESVVSPEVATAIRQHHERFDGLGYPERRVGTDIGLFGRILACAEVYVARMSARSYRKGLSPQRALAEIRHQSGTQLDPDVVAALEAAEARRGVYPADPDDD